MTPCTRVCLHSYVRWDHHCVCLYLEGFRLGLYVERELKLHPRLLQLRQRESCRWVLRRMTIPTRSPSAPYALYGRMVRLEGFALEVGGRFPRRFLVRVSSPLYEISVFTVSPLPMPEYLFDLVFPLFVGFRQRFRVRFIPVIRL